MTRATLTCCLAAALCLPPAANSQAPQEKAVPQAEAPAPTLPSPLELFTAFSRAQLAATGFSRQEARIAGQSLVWWSKTPAAEAAAAKPALVFIHGVADNAGTWFQVAPALAANHHVLLVDLPGHGESEPASGPLAMSAVLQGFETWLAEQVLEPQAEGTPAPILVGNSMGAWIALLVAHRHPERVSRVIAVNGGPLRPETGGLHLLPKDREEARRLTAAIRDPASPAIPDAVLDDLVRRAETGQARRMFEREADLESHLLEGRLTEIKTPVDVFWGESDRYMGSDYPNRLLAGLPKARLTLIPQCGHLPQAECPAKFQEKLTQTLAQEPPAAKKEEAP